MNIKRRHAHNGFITSDFSTSVIWAVSLIISLVLIVLFAATLINDIKERRIQGALEDDSLAISQQVDVNFKTINKKVNEAVTSSLPLLNESDEALTKTVKLKLYESLRVIISKKPLVDINPESFPGINYATLDMLKKTKQTSKNPIPEIHLFGQKDQYINYIYVLNNTEEKYLIVSLPAAMIFEKLINPNLSEGQITLTQKAGKFSIVKLKSWGKLPKGNDLVNKTIHVPESLFSVKYAYHPPFYLLRGMTTLSAIVGLLSSILLFIAVVLSVIKKIKENQKSKKEQQAYVPVGVPQKANNISETIQQHQNKQSEENMKQEVQLDKSIFRAYDIRGIVDESLTTDAVRLIGQSIGTENIKRGKNDIVVARDGRLSGKKLLEALIEGLNKSGCNVINIGAVPTGVLYFATHHLGTGSGVMLTGSHNPPNYNGLKIMLNGETLAGKLIMDLYKSIIHEELDEGEGNVQEMDIVDDYVDYIASDIQLENEMKVVVDSGNGIGGSVGPQVLEEIGCEVIPLHCEIDGSFPNHHPDPSVPENLQDLIASVKATDADLGIAFDGDADRLGVVTKNGDIIYSDRVLMLFARDVLTRQPGASIIFDVKCTGHLPKEIVKSGGLPIIWKTGHSFMKAKLKETQAALAGEMSGHFFFNERWFGFDDGIYAAARLLEILDQEDRPSQEVFDELPNSVSTPELKCPTKEGENYAFMEKFQKAAEFPDANLTTIDGIRADFADGWGLVRCSNTTPCLVLRFDADNQEALDKIKEEFRTQLLAVDDQLKLPF